MPRVELSLPALEDLGRIEDDLERRSPRALAVAAESFLAARALLEQFPRAGPQRYEVDDLEYRSIVAGNYRVSYVVESGESVVIVDIRHVRQRPPSLADLEARAERPPEPGSTP